MALPAITAARKKRLAKMLLYQEYITFSLKRELGLMPDEPTEDRMLKWFAFEHLREDLKEVSLDFAKLAHIIVELLAPGPERTVALRKLLEAKDAAVRAKLHPGG